MKLYTRICNYFFLGGLFWLSACQSDQPSDINMDEFILKEGFQIEIVASEPLLNSPMAMVFDERARIWVVEMPGYMRDIDGSDEELADGKIVILGDEDSDGQMDTRTVFIDSLKTPRALAFAYGGLLYTETPNLWWVPIEGDKPGKKELVDSLYVVGGNIEHQPNGLLYNLDNWFYSAKSNARYRRKNGKWEKEVTSFRGQWGISHDDEGRLFYNSNSNPLQADFTFPNQFINNPYHKASYGVKQTLDRERRVFPFQPTAVNRGYRKGILDSLGRLKRFTSACAPLIYQGDQFPKEFKGNAFVCGPEANLVKRYILKEENGYVLADPAYENSEFLVSKDEGFRPVNLYTGLDGAMYIVDLRKGIIQHRAYMTNYLREQILNKKLDTIVGLGRIYRVKTQGASSHNQFPLDTYSSNDYVELLKHPNGKLRIFAQQQLIFKDHTEIEDELEKILIDNTNPFGQIHALWTLEGLGLLEVEDLIKTENTKPAPEVFIQLLRLISLFPDAEEELFPIVEAAANIQGAKIDLQICHTVGSFTSEEATQLWLQMAEKYKSHPVFCEALISGIHGRENQLTSILSLNGENKDALSEMMALTLENINKKKNVAPKLFTAQFQDGRTKGFTLYSKFCASCHGLGGFGVEGLAPPIYHSEYISQSKERLILIALHGLHGPIEVNGKLYEMAAAMPGLKNNPELDDADIAAILSFVRNSLSEYPGGIRADDIKKIREMTAQQEEMFTAESLATWLEENGIEENQNP